MKKFFGILVCVSLLLVSLALPAFAEQVTYEKVVQNFWSPVTPSHTLDYCPASDAEVMRQELKGLIAQGMTEQQIINYYVGIYGEDILQIPPKKGFYLTAWIMPIIGLLAGIGIVYLFLIRRKKAIPIANNNVLPEIPDIDINDEMKKYL